MLKRTLYHWFEESTRRLPEATALEVGGIRLSYARLERRALAVAAAIMAGRDRPPARVALVAPRTAPSAYAGILAVQRLGATVVPLNPDHPASRNIDIAQRAGAEVVLVDRGVRDPFQDLPRRFRPPTLVVGDSDPQADAAVDGLPPVGEDVEAEAYLLFTSGTAGMPKGVPYKHRHISSYIAHSSARFEVGPDCRLSQTFGLTFDASVGATFMAWAGGATLVVPTREELLQPVDFIVRNRLTHWFSVPSAVRVAQHLGNLPLGVATTLRHSLFGAEPVTLKHARLWRSVAPNTDIYNLYGPTEAVVNCTEFRLTGDPAHWTAANNDTLPIGVLYPGMESLVIDPDGNPVDDGELCLRGWQRFDGYLDPRENDGRFVSYDGAGPAVALPTGRAPSSEHWYRTGDRVTREGVNLVHRGRLDHQVKVMGHRIELGEVEAAIHRHPGVTDAAVIAIRVDDDTRLVGVHTGTGVPAAELDRWLRRELPIHMVPTRLEHLPAMPLNDNGKIDRRALTARFGGQATPDAAALGAQR
ncbi:AMP-binding protein [Micromonospora sp. NPDC049645]|uniref:AMP-binding protein n=1 Tax=Micromonospora sp. NPDC049645 TaxID=3155508 RepID=UPI003444A1D4